MNFITILYRMFIILRCGSKILYEMLNDNWLVSFTFFSRIYLPTSQLETLIFWTKCFLATPYFKAFSLSPRGLPIPLFPTEDQRNLTHTSLSLGTKLSLARNLPRGCSLGPAHQDASGPCYIAPFCKKKKAHERALLWASWYRSCHFRNKV